ncbi:MAG: NADPH-dependent glutamate synthase [Bacillota bacterium]|nr:NADPH-dependent glutamate synthase [Thermoanaerobacteraceae bacterium]
MAESKRKPNLAKTKVPMPEQDPQARVKNFEEVALGYTPAQAVEEAKRCLRCKEPHCIDGCPVNVQIPEFIRLIEEERFVEAYHKILEMNNLPAICGRVCPQENQCEKLCLRGEKGEPVAIGRLERFAADYAASLPENGGKPAVRDSQPKGRVAVIGSGPAGLTCAADLAKAGYRVTVFEAFHTPGGVLVYGIPEFRLPKSIVQREIENVKSLGVDIQTNMVIGKVLSIDELFAQGYDAVFIGTGAGLPDFLRIPGENLNGVMSANEFLTRVNLMKGYRFPEYDTPVKVGRRVAVVGGGNVAMDAARCALRLGAEKVYIVYRRSEEEMPARREEVHHAKEEGIEFRLLTNPVRILGDDAGWVRGMECVCMELGEPDASGRRKPLCKPGSEHIVDVETVIMALGTTPNPLIARTTPGLELTRFGGIVADEATGQTSREGVFAGGDIVTGAATVILAMGAGKKAAKAIDEYVTAKRQG